MTSEEKSTKMERAERKLKQAQAEYRKALREEKEKERKAQDRHKYMMGGSRRRSHGIMNRPGHTKAIL